MIPTDLANLALWARHETLQFEDSAMTTPATETDPVGGWGDSSAAGTNDLLQATAGSRPLLDGNGGVEFDGVDDFLQTAGSLSLKPCTIGFALQLRVVAGIHRILAGAAGGISIDHENAALRLLKENTALIGTSTHTLVEDTDFTFIVTYDASGNYAFYVDGVAAGSGTNDLAISSVAPSFSSASFLLEGTIYDGFIYTDAKTGADITGLSNYLLSVLAGAPEITTTTLPNGVTESTYLQTLAATGGTGTLAWSVISGALPGGLSLNSATGEISGTPAHTGTFSFTVEVEDDLTATDTQALSIQITSPYGIYELLDLTGMDIDTATWGGAILDATFGNGYGARARVGAASGLHRWTISSNLLVDSEDYEYLIEGVPSFEYYWTFFKDHTTGDTDIFVIEWRGEFYHASFAQPDMTVEMFTIDLFGAGNGLEIRQRRVVGGEYNADGALDLPDPPEGLVATPLGPDEIEIEWEAAED